MVLFSAVARQAEEDTSLSPGSKALIAVGALLVLALFLSILRTLVARRGAWPYQPRPTPPPLPGPGGLPVTAAAADEPSTFRPLSATRRCLGLASSTSQTGFSPADAGPSLPTTSPPPATVPPVMKAIRDAIVGGTAPACPVEAPRRTCAVCLNRLSMDGGGERPRAPRRAAGASPWVCTLRCGHDFHAACVTRWAAREGAAASCPVCRKGVVEDREDEELGEGRNGAVGGGGDERRSGDHVHGGAAAQGEGDSAGGGEMVAVAEEVTRGAGEVGSVLGVGSFPA